ncbi:DUF692 domain-containing protein [Hyalangium versicolor]|uniref:DUF692 domain-containing protein n=1 Tax=Hyalangium versicolor TaxID=2861190 RepID=UPI001CCC8B55|nr:DUF692 domain-containing protein [Hyalangium versicolor]
MKPLAGVGLGWRRQLAHRIDQETELGFVEVLAEHLNPSAPLPIPLERLKERGVPLVLHAVSLGLGGAEPPDAKRLDMLAQLAERLGAVCVSEHVAFVRAAGIESGHLLPVPRADEALDVLAENVRQAQAALPVPLALENIATLFDWPSPAFTEAEFLTRLLSRTSALLLLDVANLYANALNLGTDAAAVLAAVPRERLAYVHVAGGIKHDALYHDTHAHPVPAGPLELLETLAARLGPVPALLERDDHFPRPEELTTELVGIRAALSRGVARWEAASSQPSAQASRPSSETEARA